MGRMGWEAFGHADIHMLHKWELLAACPAAPRNKLLPSTSCLQMWQLFGNFWELLGISNRS